MEIEKEREGTTLAPFPLLTRPLQITLILVDGGANVCICLSSFLTFLSHSVKTKKGNND